jgi:probable selenium-dependent hydroxylase accessory protein YqeC
MIMNELHQILSIPMTGKTIVAVCGAGGKSTMISALAEEARVAGRRVCIMTTTRIKRPESENFAFFDGYEPAKFQKAWQQGKIVAAGLKGRVFGIRPPLPEVYAYMLRETDAIYIEADGSKQLPLKFPGNWEPVLPREADHVILVAGLNALGRPLNDVCHRMELAAENLHLATGTVDERMFADILLAGYLTYRPMVVLNQADTPAMCRRGEVVASLLRAGGLDRVHVLSLKNMFGLATDNEESGEEPWQK